MVEKRKTGAGRRTLPLHLMLLPALALLIVYSYIPIFGNIIAFQKFELLNGVKGMLGANQWTGFDNFEYIFRMPEFPRALRNTIVIAFLKIVTMFIVPLVISLLLNEIRKTSIKRSVQTLIYLPHFLSWVILAGIMKEVLSTDGIINNFLVKPFGMDPVFFLGDKKLFPVILVISNLWQEFGFSTIIYLAAITSIDPSLYEAALVDGASRLRQTWHVTLPGMRPIIVLSLVLSLGGILNAGFEQVYNLLSVQTYSTGDILDTLVFRICFDNAMYDIATAVGLFKSVVSFIFISLSYWLAYRFANYEIF